MDEFMDLLKEQLNTGDNLKEVVVMARLVLRLGYGQNIFIDRSKTQFWVEGQKPFVKKQKKQKPNIQLPDVESVEQETLF